MASWSATPSRESAARPTSPAPIRSIPRCWSRNSPIGTSAAWRPTLAHADQGRKETGVMLMIDAPSVEDAFASQVTRELPGGNAETDDVLVCRQVRDETHDVRTFVFSAREPRLFRY